LYLRRRALGRQVFFQNGRSFTVPFWLWSRLWPLVQRFLWAGMRNRVDWQVLVK
jgi:hypothetical protein